MKVLARVLIISGMANIEFDVENIEEAKKKFQEFASSNQIQVGPPPSDRNVLVDFYPVVDVQAEKEEPKDATSQD